MDSEESNHGDSSNESDHEQKEETQKNSMHRLRSSSTSSSSSSSSASSRTSNESKNSKKANIVHSQNEDNTYEQIISPNPSSSRSPQRFRSLSQGSNDHISEENFDQRQMNLEKHDDDELGNISSPQEESMQNSPKNKSPFSPQNFDSSSQIQSPENYSQPPDSPQDFRNRPFSPNPPKSPNSPYNKSLSSPMQTDSAFTNSNDSNPKHFDSTKQEREFLGDKNSKNFRYKDDENEEPQSPNSNRSRSRTSNKTNSSVRSRSSSASSSNSSLKSSKSNKSNANNNSQKKSDDNNEGETNFEKSKSVENKPTNLAHEDLSDVSDLESIGDNSDFDKNDDDVNDDYSNTKSTPIEDLKAIRISSPVKINEKINKIDDGEEALDFEAEDGECVDETTNKIEDGQLGEDGDEKLEAKEEKSKEELEEGEVSDDDEARPEETEPKPVCRFYSRGQCTWGSSCRFLHPGVTDKGNYTMFEMIRPIVPGPPPAFNEALGERPIPGQIPQVLPAATPIESAWERGLRTAKEMVRRAMKRKEQDIDFEEKKLNLSLAQEELDKENGYYARTASPELIEPPIARSPSPIAVAPPLVRLRHPIMAGHPPMHDPFYPPHRNDFGPFPPRRIRHFEPSQSPVPVRQVRVEPDYDGPPMRERFHPTYREMPPHKIPDYYDKYERHDERERDISPKKIRPKREVIVQRISSPPPGRGDEWSDPWMRSKSPSGRARPREPVSVKERGRRSSYSHSNSSYSSSSSSRSSSASSQSSQYRSSHDKKFAAKEHARRRRSSSMQEKSRSPPSPKSRKYGHTGPMRGQMSGRNASRGSNSPPQRYRRAVESNGRGISPKRRPPSPDAKRIDQKRPISPFDRKMSERGSQMNPPPAQRNRVEQQQRLNHRQEPARKPRSPSNPKTSIAVNPPSNKQITTNTDQFGRTIKRENETKPRNLETDRKKLVVAAALASRLKDRRNATKRKSSRSSSGSSQDDDSSGSSSSDSESSYSSSSSSREPTPALKRKAELQAALKAKAIESLKDRSLNENKKRSAPSSSDEPPSKITVLSTNKSSTNISNNSKKVPSSRREELLKQLKAVEDAIAKKRSKIN